MADSGKAFATPATLALDANKIATVPKESAHPSSAPISALALAVLPRRNVAMVEHATRLSTRVSVQWAGPAARKVNVQRTLLATAIPVASLAELRRDRAAFRYRASRPAPRAPAWYHLEPLMGHVRG